MIVLCFDLYCLSQFGVVSEKVGTYYNTTSSMAGKMMDKYIPKYVEKKN